MTGSVVFHPAAGFGLPGSGVRFGGTPTPPRPNRRSGLYPSVQVRDDLDTIPRPTPVRRSDGELAADLAHDLTLLVHRHEGEVNDAFTRFEIRSEATALLNDYKAQRLVYDFYIEPDEHHNQPAVVDAGGYAMVAWVKPAYSLRMYRLKITMGNQPC